MKNFIKGIALGFSLVFANKLCCYAFEGFGLHAVELISAILFFIIVTVFLSSENIPSLLLCGTTGLITMFAGEILMFGFFCEINSEAWLFSYISGFYASMAALVVSMILTARQIRLSKLLFKEGEKMENNLSKDLKLRLLIYTLISAVTFTYLVPLQNAGISVPLFVLIQLICLWFIAPDRKRLLFLIPVFAMSLNCFISGSHIWRTSNLIIAAVLYGCMFMDFDFRRDNLKFILEIVARCIAPFFNMLLPFRWVIHSADSKAPVLKRVFLAVVITVPCVALLAFILSQADMVFSMQSQNFISGIFDMINLHTILLIIFGCLAGLYLFGVIYVACTDGSESDEETAKAPRFKADLIIINILLSASLLIYTLFVFIQFKYLFAGSHLPYGLTYTEYARKGFFELLFLTAVNIAAIITVIKLTKTAEGKGKALAKALCHYLCAVTVVLLVSSFYRMMLYSNDDGLTRMRLLVMGFLIFEALGLITTFFYIAKPKFNIVLIYTLVALSYYTVLNLVPIDNIIAQNQVGKYLSGERDDLDYIFTLSSDAAPAMEYLMKNAEDKEIVTEAENFLTEKTTFAIPKRWQRYNLSIERAKRIIAEN